MSSAWMHADARGRPWLAGLDPRLKLAWLLAVSTLSVLIDSLPALAALCAAAAVPLVGVKMRPRGWWLAIGLLAATVWATVFSQAVFYPATTETPRFHLLGVPFYAEGAAYGLIQSLRLVAGVSTGLAVCLSTSPERLLAAMVLLRVPLAIGFTTITALRFMPLVLEEVVTVRHARALRGYRFRVFGPRGGLFHSLRMELGLLLPVLASALRRARNLAASVTCRGFNPAGVRTFYPELRFRTGEQVAIVCLLLLCTCVATVKLIDWLEALP